jgi:hypothetical protein
MNVPSGKVWQPTGDADRGSRCHSLRACGRSGISGAAAAVRPRGALHHGLDRARVHDARRQPRLQGPALAKTAATASTLEKHNITPLIDFHQDLYNERFQGEGWPDWAVLDDGLPAQPQAGFPGNYLVQPALNRAFDNFWANAAGSGGVGLVDRYAAAWKQVARAFAGDRWVLGYDLRTSRDPARAGSSARTRRAARPSTRAPSPTSGARRSPACAAATRTTSSSMSRT